MPFTSPTGPRPSTSKRPRWSATFDYCRFSPAALRSATRCSIGQSSKSISAGLPSAKVESFSRPSAQPAPTIRHLQAPLGKLSIVEGEAFIKTKNNPSGISLDTINMYADWPRLSASADFNGQVNFRGMPVRLQGWLETPLDILRGGESAGSFNSNRRS